MKSLRVSAFAMVLAAIAAVSFTLPAFAQEAAQEAAQEPAKMEKEQYSALAQHLGTGPSGQTMVQFEITRWSTEEEIANLFEILRTQGHKKLAEALDKEKEVGFIRFPQIQTRFPSTQMTYARQYMHEGKRVVVMATNRPIGFMEAMANDDSMDYDLTALQVTLDENGHGEGVLGVGLQVTYDEAKKQFTIENWSTAPVQLKEVRKR